MVEQLAAAARGLEIVGTTSGAEEERRRKTKAHLVELGLVSPEEEVPFATTTHEGSAAVYRLDMMRGDNRILESEIYGQEDGPSFTTHHFHPDGVEEKYRVLGGEGYLMLDTEIVKFQKGVVVNVLPGVLHQVMVPPGGHLHLLIVMTNAGFYPPNRQHVPAIEHPRYDEIFLASRSPQ